MKAGMLLLAVLVACVGDSITYGSGIADRTNDSYPAQLQRILREYSPA
jgi:sialate O-acetylesterase